jgi:glyoxylase-like metal-dependent hydrolase (beta-lactamase superfamily II)
MRILLLAGATLLAATMTAGVSAQTAESAAAAATVDHAPIVAHQVHPKVHLLSTPDDWYASAIGNVVLIEQSDGFVVVDSGGSAGNGRAVVRYARSLANKPIKAVMITHWHNDHPQGISAIRDAFPKVRIIATRGTEAGMRGPESYDIGYRPDAKFDQASHKLLQTSQDNYRKLLDDPATAPDRKERIKKALVQFEKVKQDFVGSYIVLPTETFERELVINDRDVPVRMMFLGRANTEGDAVAWLPKQKIVASGDIVVSPFPFGFGSHSGDWIETLGKIKALGFTTLLPGHGQPQSDSTYLDKLIAGLTDLRAQIFPLAKAGMSLDDVKKKVDFSKSIALFGDTPRAKANVPALFFDPLTKTVYKEALGQPVVQGDLDGNPPAEVTDTPPLSTAKRHKS